MKELLKYKESIEYWASAKKQQYEISFLNGFVYGRQKIQEPFFDGFTFCSDGCE